MTHESIQIEVAKSKSGKSRVYATTPYHPEFPAAAKRLGGRWSAAQKSWSFDGRDEAKVRELVREIYGTDDSAEADLVTVRYTVTAHDAGRAELYVCGRQVARRAGRDWVVKLGDGVVVVDGGFPSSGGSMKYPTIMGTDTVVEVRDVPRRLAEAEDAEIVDAATDRRAALEAEAKKLRTRLAEIEAELVTS
jgi:hypothetical protein